MTTRQHNLKSLRSMFCASLPGWSAPAVPSIGMAMGGRVARISRGGLYAQPAEALAGVEPGCIIPFQHRA